ncbi:SRPBCC family protein [Epilithonimonas arachidiradicis]|uniref:Ligand-binding SRPBCC domain-containing protein n=1 Tax=Epilithonimonas arachidiradicis TaxID=1617282 RepID=A0A420CXD8_9FLAO|nr:SRPBCC family protein [Epilithonimonas arachidiradicis]RKE83133.1 ligand-binding SRPBCC domain-containing protein [Epilithonimonas arachidiradicis]GGG65218.1 hypothetical protein GCM10007332_29600 [Epilithonimonas arachidiradicis]
MKHQLKREQQLNCSIEKAWEFFSSANNLSVITPENMKFTVLTEFEDDDIFEGMIIDYKITPIFNIKMNWQTEITHVDYKKSFVDFQVKGPYKRWHHYHEFVENDEGVLVRDIVDYELPFGFLGEIAHQLFVKKKLDYIFNYRKDVLEVLFNRKRKVS